MFLSLAVVALLLFFYYFLYKPQLYWRNKHVNQGPPIPLFGDNFKLLMKRQTFLEMINEVYGRFRNSRYCGMYQTTLPTLMLRDPELIKQIVVKDFDHFVDHRPFTPQHVDPLWGHNLFALKGEDWKQMRATLSPAFTSSKMRTMFKILETSATQYVDYYLLQKQKVIAVELKDSFARFATDCIANCAFGLNVDSLKEPNNEFYSNGRMATDLSSFSTNLVFWLNTISPKITSFFNIRLFSKKAADFFEKIALDTIKFREEKNIVRQDVVQLLMEARKGTLKSEESNDAAQDAGFAAVEETDYSKVKKKIEFSDIEVAAQLFVFFFGGFDTISTIMSFICYELAVHPDIQDKLRQEIDEAHTKNNGELSYDVLNNLKYLDMCVSETLRMFPPGTIMERICTRSYTIKPVNNDEHAIDLNPGDPIWIPAGALHYDEEYFPNPHVFNPERFSDENKNSIKPYTYMPFGAGPRNCIGSRFALMESKTLVYYILRRFELIVIDKTVVPMKLEKGAINISIDGGFWVGLKQRND